MSPMRIVSALAVCGWMSGMALVAVGQESQATGLSSSVRPTVGDQAPDFTLSTLDGTSVSLTKTIHEGPTIVVVLRGFPGYQCPACVKQVGELLKAAKEFQAKKAEVIIVYPMSDNSLVDKAKEFVGKIKFPSHIRLVLDPGFGFVDQYGLRWSAPKETAYPATFVVDVDGKIRYANISRSHGGRADIKEILAAIP